MSRFRKWRYWLAAALVVTAIVYRAETAPDRRLVGVWEIDVGTYTKQHVLGSDGRLMKITAKQVTMPPDHYRWRVDGNQLVFIQLGPKPWFRWGAIPSYLREVWNGRAEFVASQYEIVSVTDDELRLRLVIDPSLGMSRRPDVIFTWRRVAEPDVQPSRSAESH